MRSRRKNPKRYLLGIIGGLALLCAGLLLWVVVNVCAPSGSAKAASLGSTELTAGELPGWKEVLFSGIPGMGHTNQQKNLITVRPVITAQNIVRGVVMFFTNVDITDPRSIFDTQIALLSTLRLHTPSITAMTLPNFPKFDMKAIKAGGQPLVGIYHTHTSESFIPNSGVSHKPGGQVGDIVDVGETLAKRLEQDGIGTVQSKAVHDYPSFMKAYGPSEATAKKMLEEHPSIQMIFDIHRDADKREKTTVQINGAPAASITIIVATGQQDLVQPHWQQNHAFAKLLEARMNQRYPGLSRGIQLVEWRFNQHLHPRALLLEVGCQENSKEEAARSMEMLADVLADILHEEGR